MIVQFSKFIKRHTDMSKILLMMEISKIFELFVIMVTDIFYYMHILNPTIKNHETTANILRFVIIAFDLLISIFLIVLIRQIIKKAYQ